MDSDRKIRSISLLKSSGFNITDIDDMLDQRNTVASYAFAIAEDIHSELTFSNIVTDNDHVIIRYVCGACVHSVIKCKNAILVRCVLLRKTPHKQTCPQPSLVMLAVVDYCSHQSLHLLWEFFAGILFSIFNVNLIFGKAFCSVKANVLFSVP